MVGQAQREKEKMSFLSALSLVSAPSPPPLEDLLYLWDKFMRLIMVNRALILPDNNLLSETRIVAFSFKKPLAITS